MPCVPRREYQSAASVDQRVRSTVCVFAVKLSVVAPPRTSSLGSDVSLYTPSAVVSSPSFSHAVTVTFVAAGVEKPVTIVNVTFCSPTTSTEAPPSYFADMSVPRYHCPAAPFTSTFRTPRSPVVPTALCESANAG